MNEALAVVNQSAMLAPMPIGDLIRQVQMVQNVMKTVMQEDVHFGRIPGCGDKPTLFKPGAEKLAFVFRLAPHQEVKQIDMANSHREYIVTCTLKTIGGDIVVAQGVGSCSTMESKYRFRTGPKEMTGKPVPKEFWTLRQTDSKKAQELLGGPGYSFAKNGAGEWEICQQGGKVEYDNPADYYNTVLKMAKKRAQVDATLSGTAASDIFTQDQEELEENFQALKNVTPADGSQPLSTVPHGTKSMPSQEAEGKTSSESAPKSAATTQATGSVIDWRNSTVPFGKAKGAKLGELPTENLMWWINNYVPKPFGNATTPNKSDLAFRAALDAAKEEFKKKKEAQDDDLPENPGNPEGLDDGDVRY
jgi:hypothetical protein